MNRLSCNEMTTYRWSFEEDVEQYRKAGFSKIGVWRQKISDFGEERGAELLRDSGLGVSNLLWAGGFTGSDGRTYRDAVEDGRDAILLAAALEADCLVVYTGARAGHTNKHARRLVEHAFSELLDVAEDADIVLAIEPMHPNYAAGWTCLTGLCAALDFLQRIENPRLKLVFDTYHLANEADLLTRIPDLIPRIGVVHLADGRHSPGPEQDRTRLGDGNLDPAGIVRALEAAGYQGAYDVELIGPDIEAGNYCELLCHSRRYYEQVTGRAATGQTA